MSAWLPDTSPPLCFAALAWRALIGLDAGEDRPNGYIGQKKAKMKSGFGFIIREFLFMLLNIG
ncbi:MAG TPA: hypothetical protein VKJ65_13605 [Phycisphaerae bacterium]|nr:hypothetical protein [Phycisphaerae bacterium]